MAVQHACSPYAPPRLIERTEATDQGEWLGRAFRDAEASGIYTKVREGFDADFARRAVKDLGRMLPMSLDKVEEFAIQRGWLRLDKAASRKAGERIVKAGRLSGEDEGYVAALFKVYLEGMAGGVKQLADNFLMKVKSGEDATVEGMQFAQQMQGVSRFGGYVLGWDQSVGRGLRQQGLIRTSAAGSADFANMAKADLLGNPGEYSDKFKAIAAMLNDPTRAQEGVSELIGLAKRVQFLDDPHKISRATLGMEVAGNAWQELFINGLLSSPATAVTNALGVAWTVARPLLQYGAAQGWAMTGLTGAKEASLAAAEATASLTAMYSAINDALKIGWHAARTETSIYQKVSKGISGEAARGLMGEKVISDGVYDTINKVGSFVRLPSRALLGTDEFAKHLAIRGEVAARSVRRAARAGVDLTDKQALLDFGRKELESAFDLQSPALWEKYKLDSVYNLQSGLEGAGRTIAEAAAEATFQEDNALASGVNQLLGRFPVMRPFVPFVRTPLNILKQGVWEGTGMAAISKGMSLAGQSGFNPTRTVLAIQNELLNDPAETFRIAGQIALTTTLAASVYGMAMSGQITGGGPGRWTAGRAGMAAQNAWSAAGNVPYSLRVGDQAIPFDRFGEPMAIVMRMFADLGMYSAYMTAEDQEEVFSGMVSIAASGLYQASFLQGIEALVKLGQEDSDYALGAAFQNYAATQTPFGGLLAFVDRVQDPYKAAYQGASFAEVLRVHEDTFGTGIFGKLANRIPGAGSAPQLVDQLTGNPVPIVPGVGPGGLNPLQMAIPLFPRNNRGDEVWKAVFDISGSYMERRPSEVKLTAKEQQQLNGYMASSRVNGQTLAQRILALRRRADVQQYVANKGAAVSATKFAIEKELDGIIREHYEQAKMRLFQNDAGVMQRLRVAETRNIAAEMNQVGEADRLNSELDALYQRARRGF